MHGIYPHVHLQLEYKLFKILKLKIMMNKIESVLS